MTLLDDVRAMCTGFGSVRVLAGAVTTRGLFDDADVVADTGPSTALYQVRALLLVAADVPSLAREDTISIGTVTDDADLTDYRVVDLRRQNDGLVLQVLVTA